VLQILITLKNPSPSAGFEPSNLGSNGKHDKHYTTKAIDTHVNTVYYIKYVSNVQISTSHCLDIRSVWKMLCSIRFIQRQYFLISVTPMSAHAQVLPQM
jgi:hypothetical protein